jgi:uncharacterized RDD family membrane protein YckC
MFMPVELELAALLDAALVLALLLAALLDAALLLADEVLGSPPAPPTPLVAALVELATEAVVAALDEVLWLAVTGVPPAPPEPLVPVGSGSLNV